MKLLLIAICIATVFVAIAPSAAAQIGGGPQPLVGACTSETGPCPGLVCVGISYELPVCVPGNLVG